MRHKVEQLLRREDGDSHVSILIYSLIVIFFLFLGLSIWQYTEAKSTINSAANEVLQVMKVQNGANAQTRQQFNDLLVRSGMDPSTVTFQATPQTVQRGDLLEIKASKVVDIYAAKILGLTFTLPINVKVTGLAHKLIREGG
ncbi:DUF4320 family protein [Paenibacillus phytohabitans]|nr:DUF4320 family protein [Paenibacillus phytohabitans]